MDYTKCKSEQHISHKEFLFGNLEILRRVLREAPDFEGKSEALRCLEYAFSWEDKVKDVEDQ